MNIDQILILTAGGTIDKVYFDQLSEYQVGPSGIDRVLRAISFASPYRVVSLLQKDSLDMTDADRALIRSTIQDAPEQRIMITHGTDTMIQTACSLLTVSDRRIVLTGAMQPAGFHDSDAVFNIGFALGVLQSLSSPGVWVAMNGQLLAPQNARKNREQGVFENHLPEAE